MAAPKLSPSRTWSREHLAAEVLADGDIFHLGRDDAAAGVVHLADVGAGLGAERRGGGRWGRAATPPRAVGAELAIVLGADLARGDFLDIAAAADPVAAQLGQAGHDVDARRRGRCRGRWCRRRVSGGSPERRLEVDRAHRDAQRRPTWILRLPRIGPVVTVALEFGMLVRATVGHDRLLSLRRCQPDQVRRVAVTNVLPLSRYAAPRGPVGVSPFGQSVDWSKKGRLRCRISVIQRA